MKIGVVGSRSIHDYDEISKILNTLKIDTIVSGGAQGVDKLAEKYATKNNIPVEIYLPQYDKYGRRATYFRNLQIVQNSDMIIAFWDGESKGTQMTIEIAKKNNVEFKVYKISNERS